MTTQAHAAGALRMSREVGERRQTRLSGIEIAILALVVVVIVCAALLPSLITHRPPVNATTVIQVSEQDTLWQIAREHPIAGMSTAENVALIEDLNEMSGSAIAAGQILRVPSSDRPETAMASR